MSWITDSEGARLFRPGSAPAAARNPARPHQPRTARFTPSGSVDFYSTYPGMYVPRPLGIRPVRPISSPAATLAAEILALYKDELEPDTPGRAGLHHHPRGQPGKSRSPLPDPDQVVAARYANYM